MQTGVRMASTPELRRWRAGIWPNTPPPRPGLGFPGPVGLWAGGALVSYELAEHQGLIEDERLRHPPPGTYSGQLTANDRRANRWQREEQSGRGEVYLQLLEVDLDDVDSVLDFASTFGPLDIRALDAPRASRQWFGVASEQPVPFRVLRHYPGFGDLSRHAARDGSFREPVLEIVHEQRAAAPTWVISETLEEFRWGARAIRDLQAAWLCLREGSDPREAPWANQRMPTAASEADRAQWEIAEFLERTMRDALDGFSPRLWLVDAESERASFRAVTSPAPTDVTLFEVLVLELFRHIAEDASYKRCANPTCGRTFVRQEGGAIHQQSRMSGVLYCTRRCAKAVAQRRYRRRRTATDGH